MKILSRLSLVLLLTLVSFYCLNAQQISQLAFQQSTETYTDITGGTVLASGGNFDDNTYLNQPIGFTFNYNGVDYTTFNTTINGYIQLGTPTSWPLSLALSSTATSNVISPFNRDLYLYGTTNVNASLSYTVEGTAPTRVFVLQWKDISFIGYSTTIFNFQIRLYETTNRIEFRYGPTSITGFTSEYPVEVGLKSTNADWQNRTTTSNWAATTAGTAINNTCSVTPTVYPANGLSFNWLNVPNYYVGAVTTQNTNSILVGSDGTNSQIIGLVITTSGGLPPMTQANYFVFDPYGTTDPEADITNAKLWYTGTNPNFDPLTATQIGSTVPEPWGEFTIFQATNVVLANGNNYFWLTFDVNTDEDNLFHTIDARCLGFTTYNAGEGTERVPTPIAPPGFRRIMGPLSGTFTVGNTPDAFFPNLGAAFSAINGVGLVGNVELHIVSNIVETGPATLNQWTEPPDSPGYFVTIRPIGGDWTVSTNTAVANQGFMNFNGADRVIIDGQFYNEEGEGDSQRHLTFMVNSGLANIFGFYLYNNANNNTFRYINVYMGTPEVSTQYAFNIVSPNVNTTIQYCFIGRTGWGIRSYATSTTIGSTVENLTIRYNTIGGTTANEWVSTYAIYMYYNLNPTISNNNIIGMNSATLSTVRYGMYLSYCLGPDISYNNLYGFRNTSNALYGIYPYYTTFNRENGGIYYNNIYDFQSSGYIYCIYNYYYSPHTAPGSGIYYNNIYDISTTSYVYGIYNYYSNHSGANSGIKYNNVYNITSTTGYMYGIYSSYSQFTGENAGVMYNNVYNITTTGSGGGCYSYYIYGMGSQVTPVFGGNNGGVKYNTAHDISVYYAIYGIYHYYDPHTGENTGIMHNNIYNLTSAASTIYGIFAYYSDMSGTNAQLSYNTLQNVSTINYGTVYGIYAGYTNFPNLTNRMSYNLVKNIVTNNYAVYAYGSIYCTLNKFTHNRAIKVHTKGTTYAVYGLYVAGTTGTGTNTGYMNLIANNEITDLKVGGGSTSIGYGAHGIWIAGGTYHKIYNNSINLFGLPYQGNVVNTSTCVYISSTAATYMDFKNNVFKNTISGPTGTLSYAVWTPYTTWASSYSTINYNNYYVTPGVGYCGRNGAGTNFQTLTLWRTFTGQDANSFEGDPMYAGNDFLAPQYGSPLVGAGISLPDVPDDIMGTARQVPPTIGCYEKVAQALISPANGEVEVATNPTVFIWQAMPGAARYHLKIGTDENLTNIIYENENITTTTFSYTGLQNLTYYWWNVAAFTEDGSPAAYPSGIWGFLTGGPIDPPTLLAPANDIETPLPFWITASWTPVFTAQQYQMQIATDMAFSDIVYDGLFTATTIEIPNVLAANTVYYWRVRAIKPLYTSAWSSVWGFLTGSYVFEAESFTSTTFPPTGWATYITGGTSANQWARVTQGSFPTNNPRTPPAMAQYNSWGASTGHSAALATKAINFMGVPQAQRQVSFWLYRHNAYPAYGTENVDGLVQVYVNNTQNTLAGAQLLMTINTIYTREPAVPAVGWYQYTVTVPDAYASQPCYIIFNAVSDWWNNIQMDDVAWTVPIVQNEYVTSTAYQGEEIFQLPVGAQKKAVMAVEVLTEGFFNPCRVTQMVFNTEGTDNTADIARANLYYTGSSPVFNNAVQFGSTVVNPEGEFSFTGNLQLLNGSNYFWLTYDIADDAGYGDILDAQYTGITICGESYDIEEGGNPEGAAQVRPQFPFDNLLSQDISSNVWWGRDNLYGLATDGTYQYASNPTGGFVKYDMRGDYVEAFTITGVPGLYDLTYDGTYFYGGSLGNTIYQLDFSSTPPSLVGTITLPAGTQVRACAYDPNANDGEGGFWVADRTGTRVISLFSLEGELIASISQDVHQITDISGIAYDGWSPGGPYLWAFRDIGTLVQLGNIYTGGSLTGQTRNILPDLDMTVTTPSAGGVYSYITDDEDNPMVFFGGIVRSTGTPNIDVLFKSYFLTNIPMEYLTTLVNHPTTYYIFPGDEDQVILGVQVVTRGMLEPLTISSMTFNTTGSTDPETDIVVARLYYTGFLNEFSTDNLLGEYENPNGTFTIPFDDVTLYPGVNYFWLTYDIADGATILNYVDAQCTSVLVNGIPRVVASPAPAGARRILGPLQGIFTVGTNGDFPHFNSAFEAVGLVGLAGNVDFQVISNITEPNWVFITPWQEIGEGGYFINIYPTGPTGTQRIIDCSANFVTFFISAADRIRINGALNNTGNTRNLIIRNSANEIVQATWSIPVALVRQLPASGGGVVDVQVKNCILQAFNNTKTLAMGLFIGASGASNGQPGEETNNILIDNNKFERAYYGIYSYRSSTTDFFQGIVYSNNDFGSTVSANQIAYNAIYMNQGYTGDQETRIDHNKIHDMYVSPLTPVYGIYLYNSTGVVVDGNSIYNLANNNSMGYATYGIYVSAGTNNLISNNEIWNISAYGSTTQLNNPAGIYVAGTTNSRLFYNSVNMYGGFGGTTGPYYSAAIGFGANTGTQMKNNTFKNTMTGPGDSYCFAIYQGTPGGYAEDNPDYNNYYGTTLGAIGTTLYTNINQWRTATGADMYSISANPQHIANDNLNLLLTSPLIFGGTPVADVTTDILGATRGALPTIGAYEYTGTELLPPPVLVAPANLARGVIFNPCVFQWNSVTGATRYTLQYSTTETFESGTVTTVENLTGTSYSVNLNQLTEYWWRMKALNDFQESNWSYVRSFITTGPLPAPILVSPANMQGEVSPNPTLTWLPVFGAASYQVVLSSNPNFVPAQTYTTNTNSINITGLANGTTYYWNVRATDGTTWSPWSAIWRFTTASQVLVDVGTGTSFNTSTTWPAPYGKWYNSARHQFLILASELYALGGMPGAITSLAFNVQNPNTCGPCPEFQIKMKHVTYNTLSPTFDYTGLQNCYGPVTYTPFTGWNTHVFSTPFTWNGVDNILVDVCFSNYPYGFTTSASTYYTAVSFNGSRYLYTDGANYCTSPPATATTSTWRTNMRLNMVGAGSGSAALPVPLLVAPEHQATGVPSSPTFEWSLLPGDGDPTNYNYNLFVWSDNPNAPVINTVVEGQTTYFAMLQENTTYFWKVRTVQGTSNGSWSATFQFTTVSYCTAGAESCVEDFDEYIQNVTVNTINNTSGCGLEGGYSDYRSIQNLVLRGFSYPITVTNGNGYEGDQCRVWVDWDQNGVFGNNTNEIFNLTTTDFVTFTGTILVPTDAPYGVTRMRVRLADADFDMDPCGISLYGEVEDYSVQLLPLVAPQLIAPANGATALANPIVFEWSAPTGATYYTLQYSTTSDFAEGTVTTINNIEETTYSVDLEPLTNYWWRVKAFNVAQESPWSGVRTFFTTGPIGTPTLISPLHMACGLSPQVTFQWAPVYAANTYEIMVSENPNFMPADIYTSNTTSKTVMLQNGRTYYWQVRASDGTTWGDWSYPRRFTTAVASLAYIGTGTTYNNEYTYPAPYGKWYNSARHQFLILASELVAAQVGAGPITSLAFNVAAENGCGIMPEFQIKMKHTNVSSLTGFDLTGLQNCFGPVTYYATTGWNTHTFSTPFVWNGVDNVLVDVCFSNYPNGFTYNASTYWTTTSFTSAVWSNSDGSNLCTSPPPYSSTGTNRPNMRLQVTPTTTAACLPVPYLVYPEHEAVNIPYSLALEWTLIPNEYDGDPYDYSYQVVVWQGAGEPIYDEVVDNLTQLTVSLAEGQTYFWKARVISGNDVGGWSATFQFTTVSYCPAGAMYCVPELDPYIANFNVGLINNTSECGLEGGYSDYTDIWTVLTRGYSYPVTLVNGNGAATDQARVWVDFNMDGEFSAGEGFNLTSVNGGVTFTGTITVPADATVGAARIRVRLADGDFDMDPCGISTYGEVEDYTGLVQPVPPVLTLGELETYEYCQGSFMYIPFTVSDYDAQPTNRFRAYIGTEPPTFIGEIGGYEMGDYVITGFIPGNLPAGDYEVWVQSTNPIAFSESATITVNAVPTVYNMVGNGIWCEGEDGAYIGLDGSEEGIIYQLMFDGEPLGDPLIGTGDELTFGYYTELGTYEVLAYNEETECASLMDGQVVINQGALPLPTVYTVTGGGGYCAGGQGVQIGLSGSQLGAIYQLIYEGEVIETRPGTGNPITFVGTGGYFTAEGIYTVNAILAGCQQMMAGYAEVMAYPQPEVFTVGGGGSFCPGAAEALITLSGSEEGVTYRLLRNGIFTGIEIEGTGEELTFGPVSLGGIYTIMAYLSGCQTLMSGYAQVTMLPAPFAYDVVSLGGGSYCEGTDGVDITLMNSQPGYTYRLYLDGELVQTFLGTGAMISMVSTYPAGTYTIDAVHPVTGCVTQMNGSVTVVVNSVVENPLNRVPANGATDVAVDPETVFNWDVGACVDEYRLIVSENYDLSDPIIDEVLLPEDLPYTTTELAEGTTYYWVVVTWFNDEEYVSDLYTFTTETLAPTLTIALNQGWNMISSNLDPLDPNMANIWQNNIEDLVIIKNGVGQFWMPSQGAGTLTTWNVYHGYQVYVTEAGSLAITGLPVDLEVPYNLTAGWHLVSYLPQLPLLAPIALNSISDVLVVAKDGMGGIYWPMYGVNTLGGGTGYMMPTKGYQLYLIGNGSLLYPAGNPQIIPLRGENIPEPKAKYLVPRINNTGNDATMIIEAESIPSGSEIGVYNSAGELVGSGVVNKGRAVVVIWGDNIMTKNIDGAVEGEELTIKLYDASTAMFEPVRLSEVYELTTDTRSNSVEYRQNGLFVVKVQTSELPTSLSIKNIPNPFETSTKIEWAMPVAGNVEITIYNLQGELVARVVSGHYEAGIHSFLFNSGNLAAGAYQLVLKVGSERATQMMMITK